MNVLIDASLPRSTNALLIKLGHQTTDVRDLGERIHDDSEIAAFARKNQLLLMTADFDFANIREYPPEDYFGLVVIDRPENAKVADVLEMVERFAMDFQMLDAMPGRLAIVSATRVRIRPPLPETKS